MAIKALNHWLVNSDVIAAEFDRILRLSVLFPGMGAGDPDLTFAVVLTEGVQALTGQPASFARASAAVELSKPRGILKLAPVNVPRIEWPQGTKRGTLFEFDATNLCDAGDNANPPSVTEDFILIGDPAAQLLRVFDGDALQEANLDGEDFVSGNMVLELDNRAGSTDATVSIVTSNAVAGRLAGTMYVRGDALGALQIQFAPQPLLNPLSESYERLTVQGDASSPNAQLQLRIDAGGWARFILWDLQQTPVPNSTIRQITGPTTRARDGLTYPQFHLGKEAIDRFTGMAAIVLTFGFESSDIQVDSSRLLLDGIESQLNPLGNLIYLARDTGQDGFYNIYFSAFVRSVHIAIAGGVQRDKEYVVALWWEDPIGRQIGYKVDGVWAWSSVAFYDGLFKAVEPIEFSNWEGSMRDPISFARAEIWNVSRGTAWIEDHYKDFAN